MKAMRRAFLPTLLGILVMSGAPGQVVGQDEDVVSVAVQNNGASDAQVYALQGGHMVPIGLVSAGDQVTLAIPSAMDVEASGLRLAVDLIGSTDWHMSEHVAPSEGGVIELTIEAELDRSSVRVGG